MDIEDIAYVLHNNIDFSCLKVITRICNLNTRDVLNFAIKHNVKIDFNVYDGYFYNYYYSEQETVQDMVKLEFFVSLYHEIITTIKFIQKLVRLSGDIENYIEIYNNNTGTKILTIFLRYGGIEKIF